METDNLFPEDMENELDVDYDDSETVIGYKKSPQFDMERGEFLMNGSGQILSSDEVNAYVQWCEIIIATDRYKHDAYTDDIGIDYEAIFAAYDKEEAETIIESEISEALMCDPYGRTLYVQNLEFEWIGPDELNITVEIMALDNELVTVNTTIKR